MNALRWAWLILYVLWDLVTAPSEDNQDNQ
jgi:hypothetical protein